MNLKVTEHFPATVSFPVSLSKESNDFPCNFIAKHYTNEWDISERDSMIPSHVCLENKLVENFAPGPSVLTAEQKWKQAGDRMNRAHAS